MPAAQAGGSLDYRVIVSNFDAAFRAVAAGLGVSVVPTLTLFHFEQPDLVTRPLALPGLVRQIYLVRRRDRSLSVAAQALYTLMVENRPAH